jgi:hypothetical protein
MTALNFSDLKEGESNPRKITGEKFEQLTNSLLELGDLGGIVVNRATKEIIGGNQRVKSFSQDREKYTIELVEEYPTKTVDGTLARGFIVKDKGTEAEQKFSYREVEWTPEQAKRAMVQANKVTGMWDYDILANAFNTEDLLQWGFTKSDLDLLPKEEVVTMDNDGLTKSMDTYLEGNIKQVVIFVKSDEYDSVVTRLDKVMEVTGTEDHSSAFLAMLDYFENGNAAA